jgi:hypothetical protein
MTRSEKEQRLLAEMVAIADDSTITAFSEQVVVALTWAAAPKVAFLVEVEVL